MANETYVLECSTVPTIGESDVKFSVGSGDIKRIKNSPLKYAFCEEITPPQHRIQWGVPTQGARGDFYYGLRVGSDEYNLELGARSTLSDSALKPVEDQRVGVATLTLAGQFKLSYWNDHQFWWFPMGGGTDQGDTAGVRMSYNLGNRGFFLENGWRFRQLSLILRLATGIPVQDKKSIIHVGKRSFYSQVEFSEIDRGDIAFSSTLTNNNHQILDIGLGVNSGEVRNLLQSQLVHKNLRPPVPEFPLTRQLEVYIYIKLQNF